MTTKEACDQEFYNALESRGVSRRAFLGFCAGIAVTLGLSEAYGPQIAQAIAADSVIGNKSGNLAPAIWLEQASCTGCTESLAQVDTPDVATIVLELLSLNYSETLSAAAGYSMEEAREQTIAAGGYILIVEGAVMEGWDNNALRIAGETGVDILLETAKSAAAVVAVGSCAVDGGWQASGVNPAGATGVQAILKKNGIDKPIINLPACPVNPEWIVAVLIDYLLLGTLPELNSKNEPALMFNQPIHDNCPRRGHFENGEFVYQYGTEEEKLGYCLYPLGCKGPTVKSNCPIVRWNAGVSWCVESGAPCIGCADANPSMTGHNWVDQNAPFQDRFRWFGLSDSHFTAPVLAASITGVIAVALCAHGVGMKLTGRMDGGADFESMSDYEKKRARKAAAKSEGGDR
jgi:hydrogenase small subunit